MGNKCEYWDISPSKPVIGDTLTIYGKSLPNESIELLTSFDKNVPVSSEGDYEYYLEKMNVPEGIIYYTITAVGVKYLKLGVKLLFWFTRKKEASHGTAVFYDKHIPSGSYDIKIYGKAKDSVSKVNINIKVLQSLKADNQGNFRYDYDTSSLPEGKFLIGVENTSKRIELKNKS
ncbi:hypothetical protein [Methanohalobium sp.]|uniref:hypothetical protein n=1 Tax=Methanohalobium sp. TaxID=2837493 RepID=UPI0025F8AE2B|nr:hypothetical protein [Methanohalobium sp.]